MHTEHTADPQEYSNLVAPLATTAAAVELPVAFAAAVEGFEKPT
jgi:hypothetical protein